MAQTVNEEPQLSGGDMIWLIILMIMLFFACASMSSCSTSKSVQKETITHDTLFISKHDTIDRFQQIKCWDTIREFHDTTIVVKEDGTPVMKTITNNIYHDTGKVDSSSYYKSVIDSLMKASNSKSKEVDKKTTTPSKSLWNLFLVAIVIGLIVLSLLLYKRKA